MERLPVSVIGHGSPKSPDQQLRPQYEGQEYFDIDTGDWWIVEDGDWVESHLSGS